LESARQGLDWGYVADLAAVHGVRPHLLRALSESVWAGRSIELRQKLKTFQGGHMARNLYATRELLSITSAFNERGISFATFKGVALAVLLHGDISRREFNDIDIVVHQADVRAAEEVLEANGYHAVHGSSREYRQAFLSYQRQYMFKDLNSVLMIDLHWDFTFKGVPFPLQASEIWSTLTTVSIGGRAVPILGLEELAVFLAGHGTKEGWRCLGWVSDFAEFYQQHCDLNWNELWERTDRKGCGRPILLGLSLATKLLDVPVDTKLLERADRDPALRNMVQLAVQRMMYLINSKNPNPNPETELLTFEMCEAWYQRLNIVWQLASTRTTGDYEAMPLPRPLWRLYHLTRPFRLASKFLSLR
jgi:Uncharacterised nucleotidyltransferase